MPQDFGRSFSRPLLAQLEQEERDLGLSPAAPRAAAQPSTALEEIERVAMETGVPVNVILADPRLSRLEDPAQAIELARQTGTGLSQHFRDGVGLTDALEAAFGDRAQAETIATRALEIGQQLYPDRFEAAPAPEDRPERSAAGALARRVGGSAISGMGQAVQGLLGRGLEGINDLNVAGADLLVPDLLIDWVNTVGEWTQERGEALSDTVGEREITAMMNSTPGGDPRDRSTWTLGEDPSLYGYALHAADVFGSMVPVVLSGLAAGPGGAAAVGGGMAGEDAAQTAEGMVDQFYEDGSLQESPRFQRFVAQGMSEEEAYRRIREQSGDLGFVLAMPIGALSGGATHQIVNRGLGGQFSGNMASRALQAGLVSAVEEGTAESLEGIAARGAAEAESGVDVNLMENTVGDFLLGALGGGPMGAFGGIPRPVNTGEDDRSDLAPPPVAEQPAQPPAPDAEPPMQAPAGPISEALQAVGERFGNLSVGEPVNVVDPDGLVTDAEFVGETAEGVTISRQGRTFVIDNDMLEAGTIIEPRFPQGQDLAQGQPATPREIGEPIPPEARAMDQAEFDDIMGPEPGTAAYDEAQIEALLDQARLDRIEAEQEQADLMSGVPNMPETPDPTDARYERPESGEVEPGTYDRPGEEYLDGGAQGELDIQPEDETKRDGSPFVNASAAEIALQRRGLNPEDFDLLPVGDGVVARPRRIEAGAETDMAGETPSPNDPSAYGSVENIDMADVTKRDGSPFVSEEAATRALQRRGMNPEDFQLVPMQGGVVARPLTAPATGLQEGVPSANDPAAYGGLVPMGEADATAPGGIGLSGAIDEAAARVETSPTDAQKEAGNYRKGHVNIQGLDVTIENPMGSERSGTGPDGSRWSVTMPAHYGYVKRSEGADGDHVDVYVGPNPDSTSVWVVDQVNPDTREFDEHKVILGANSQQEAETLYVNGFSDGRGRDRMGGVSQVSMDWFRDAVGRKDVWTKPLNDSPNRPVADLPETVGEAYMEDASGDGEMRVSVTRDGPWDFNDTWPAPDPERLQGRLNEGRNDGLDSPSAVVFTLDETLNDLVGQFATGNAWRDQIARINAGEKPNFRVKRGDDPLDVARRNMEAAYREAEGTLGAIGDIWGDEATTAIRDEARRRAEAERRGETQAPPDTEDGSESSDTDGQDAGKGENNFPSTEQEAAGRSRSDAQSLKLRDFFNGRPLKLLAKAQGKTVAGEVLGQIDDAVRRMADGLAVDGVSRADVLDGTSTHQFAVAIREGVEIAGTISRAAAGNDKDIGWPSREEDTGDFIEPAEGSTEYPAWQALEWLDMTYALGAPAMEGDIGAGDATSLPEPMSEDQVFPAPAETVDLSARAKTDGTVSLEEAEARLASWKRAAAEIGKTGANADKVIISLFDYSGAWAQPWRDAGYQVRQFDIKAGADIITDDWIWNQVDEIVASGAEVYGVLSACPCTTFAGSGARWWADRHDVESPEAVRQVFGDRAVMAGAKSPRDYNVMLYQATRDMIAKTNPTGFHILENPIGRIEAVTGLPKPTARFHPHNFGNPYTKRTSLYGDFNPDMPLANVDPVEGSKMQAKLRGTDALDKERRSETPEGFAYAFFMANDPEAQKALGAETEANAAPDTDPFDRSKGTEDTWNPYSVREADLGDGYGIRIEDSYAIAYGPDGDILKATTHVRPTVMLDAIDRARGIRDGLNGVDDQSLQHYGKQVGFLPEDYDGEFSWEERADVIRQFREGGYVGVSSGIVGKAMTVEEVIASEVAALDFAKVKGGERLMERFRAWLRANPNKLQPGRDFHHVEEEGRHTSFNITGPRPADKNDDALSPTEVSLSITVYGDRPLITTAVPPGKYNYAQTDGNNTARAIKHFLATGNTPSPDGTSGNTDTDGQPEQLSLWDTLDAAGREEVLRDAGLTTKAGKLTAPARRSLDKGFAELGKAVREAVQPVLDARVDETASEGNEGDIEVDDLFDQVDTADRNAPRIEDFGEKIPGARKHRAMRLGAELRGELDVGAQPLSKSFPAPDYEALEATGVPRDTLAVLATIRGRIEKKPRGKYKRYRLGEWAEDVQARRETVADLLDGKIGGNEARGRFGLDSAEEDVLHELLTSEDMPLEFLPFVAQAKIMSNAGIRQADGSWNSDGWGFTTPWTGYRLYARAEKHDMAAELLEVVAKHIDAKNEQAQQRKEHGGRKPVEFSIREWRTPRNGKPFVISFKTSSSPYINIKDGFATRDDAKAYIAEHEHSLREEADRMRDGLNERLATNRRRKGPKHRDGDATPEMFQETFAFRGVQFGNQMTGKNRVDVMNDTWDALHDLAGVLDLPLKALSLDGKLGLAFGARGKGGRNPAAAHYEPDMVVINLTKRNGAGSLAHEWWHAIDHYLGKTDAKNSDRSAAPTAPPHQRHEYATDRGRSYGSLTAEEWKAIRALNSALKSPNRGELSRAWLKRAKEADKLRSPDYFSTTIEMAARGFEKVVVDRLAMRGMINDFLANIDQNGGAYPSTQELRVSGVGQAFDDVLAAVAERLADKGEARVTLPDADPSLVDNGPQVGFRWVDRYGAQIEITARDGDRATIKAVDAAGEEDSITLDLAEIEERIARDAAYHTPEAVAEREAEAERRRAAIEQAEAKRERWRPVRQQAEELVERFITERRRKPSAVRNTLLETISLRGDAYAEIPTQSRAAHVLTLMRDQGWGARGNHFGSENGSFFPHMDQKLVQDFAAFVEAENIQIVQNAATEGDLDAMLEELRQERLDDGEAPQEGAPADVPASDQGSDAEANGDDAETGGVDRAPLDDETLTPEEEAHLFGLDEVPERADAPAEPRRRSAGEAGRSAAKNAADAVREASQGLANLFGGDGTKLNAGFTFDRETYEQAKPHFTAALKALGAAGQDLREMAAALIDGLRAHGVPELLDETVWDRMKPYMMRYLSDVQSGQIDPWAEESDTAAPQEDQTDDNSPDASDGGAEPDRSGPAAEAGEPGTPRQSSGSPRETGGGERATDRPRGRSGGAAGAGRGNSDNGAGRTGADGATRRNHVIEQGALVPAGGAKSRARQSLEAIRTLKAIDKRSPTPEERKVLARYGGAGTLAAALPRSDGASAMPDILAELEDLLNPQEMRTLSQTSQYAFYTAEPVVRGMWRLAEHLGFKGGLVYEPGMGVGGFAGTVPQGVRSATRYTGLELDHVTAKIAAALYPESRIAQGDFIKTRLPRDHYDLVIGNPPFAATRIKSDTDYPQGFEIHDYFFAKSLDAVRPGGILMFVSSAGTMNKLNARARNFMAKRADLVGAIRLPSSAFKDFAGTEVTTDVVVLRKRAEGETEADASWRESTTISLPDGEGGTGEAAVNRYFQSHPEMILGEQGLFDTLVPGKKRVGVRSTMSEQELAGAFIKAIAEFPENVMSERQVAEDMDVGSADITAPEHKTGGFYLKDGELYQFDGRVGQKVQQRGKGVKGGRTKGDMDRIRALVPIKFAMRDVYRADLHGQDATAARAELNRAYDAFVAEFGPINKVVKTERRPSRVELEGLRQKAFEAARSRDESYDIGSFDPGPLFERGDSLSSIARARAAAMELPGYREGDFDPDSVPSNIIAKRPNIDPFMEDQDGYRIRALEHFNEETGEARKTLAFTENAIHRPTTPKINGAGDALLHVMAETGRVDLRRIADLAGLSDEAALAELGEDVFFDPATEEWQTRDRYLSGNIYAKIEQAEAYPDKARVERNIEALRDVVPPPIPPQDIFAAIGASWFPASLYSEWAESLGLSLEATYTPVLGVWNVEGTNSSAAAISDYGTADIPFGKLMNLMMNGRTIEVKKKPDRDSAPVLVPGDTQAANEKAEELRQRFNEWFWSDESRAKDMAEVYNRGFNAERAPEFDGAYLTTPGINANWSWRPHQRRVVARILQAGNTYMAHAVGAGKTSAMIGAGMEARRLGLARKPMYAVPNHMLEQFATEFYEQYPLARIMVADQHRFHTSRRKQFMADLQTADVDAVIVTHSALELLPVSQAKRAKIVGAVVEDMAEAMSSLDKGDRTAERGILGALRATARTLGVNVSEIDGEKVATRKKIEQMIEAARERIESAANVRGQDEVVDFEDLGVDMLFVDEAHLFRKLSFITQKSSVKGVDPEGSTRAMDLYLKTRIIEEHNPGRGLVFASGTPITNTMGELFSLSRFIQPSALEQRGITTFDGWAQTFGQLSTEFERTPAGGFRDVTRFAKFVNVPELSLMVRQVMDVVTSRDLEQYVTRPRLKNGTRTQVLLPSNPEQKRLQQRLAARMAKMKTLKPEDRKGDYHHFSIAKDGRMGAIDPRLVDPSETGEGSKLSAAIRNIHRIWKDSANQPLHGIRKEGGYTAEPVEHGPATQMVFSTMGIGGSKNNPSMKVHEHIKAELVALGIPAREIIIQADLKSDALKQRAFNDMNAGRRRILIGGESLFTGVNAQRRLLAIHNLDPLWFPANDEQRNGRGLRQGNMNPEIEIIDYIQQDSYDATMWQLMARKASFIDQFYAGDPEMRQMEDLGEASAYEQATAMAISDRRVIDLQNMKSERDALQRRKKNIDQNRYRLAANARMYQRIEADHAADATYYDQLSRRVEDLSGKNFKARINGKDFTERKEAGKEINELVRAALEEEDAVLDRPIGVISSFRLALNIRRVDMTAVIALDLGNDNLRYLDWTDDPVAMMRKIENPLRDIAPAADRHRQKAELARKEIADTQAALNRVEDFKDQDKLDSLNEQISALESELKAESKKEEAGGSQRRRTDEGGTTAPEIRDALRDRISEIGLSDQVVLDVVNRLTGQTADGQAVDLDARQIGRLIQVALDSADALGALNHEIIHLLRDPDLWGRPYGLFTRAEWQALVRQSRREKGITSRVARDYPDLTARQRTEEVIAEMFREWANRRRSSLTPVAGLLRRIGDFLRAVGDALSGLGLMSADEVFAAIEGGEVASRAPQPRDGMGRFRQTTTLSGEPVGRQMRRVSEEEQTIARRVIDHFMMVGESAGNWAKRAGRAVANLRTAEGRSDVLTDAMVGSQDGRFSVLSLVPGAHLLSDLARNLPSARRYQRFKDEMDALRNEWHSIADETATEWARLMRRNREANETLMDIMHRATISQIDPSASFASILTKWDRTQLAGATRDPELINYLAKKKGQDNDRRQEYDELRRLFATLPREFRDLYRRVQQDYRKQTDAMEDAVIANIDKSMEAARVKAERAYERERQRLRDDGVKGKERRDALDRARKRRDQTIARLKASKQNRVAALRAQFESNRLKGPYFPLSRQGQYFVTLRDADGMVTSFSLFETKREQREFAQSDEAKAAETVETGVMSNEKAVREQIAPQFIADIQKIVGDWDVDERMMDEIWQRYLQTLPDASLRTQRIHRKGTKGYSRDAYRAYARHMFHGAHQLARLTHGIDLQNSLEGMRTEARIAADPERAMAVVNEIEHRHAFTMNPTGGPVAQFFTQLAFVWYLGATPAAAMVNLSQTTVVGPAVLGAKFKKSGITGAVRELGRASKEFVRGKGWTEQSKALTTNERRAMEEGFRRGVIDRTQAHDLAGVAESGIAYSAARQAVMRTVSAAFHHAERLNREVTYLAAYRMARKEGLGHDAAIDAADQATLATHFDYQNTSRPRVMQGDVAKVVFTFRNFTINMIYRLVRDVHQAFKGADTETRREARIQLLGITTSMFLHAGIRGVWGWGILSTILGMFFPGDDDDLERHMQTLLAGDDDETVLGQIRQNVAGIILNGVPGHVMGVSMSERIGMPNLWFRESNRLEDEQEWLARMATEVLGPSYGILEGFARGAGYLRDGNVTRAIESAAPKFVRDAIRSGRYLSQGVTTRRGDPIVDEVSIREALSQALGFTPARVAERYAANSRMMNRQERVMNERRGLMREAGDALMANRPIPQTVLDAIRAFNAEWPEYPIDRTSLSRSVQARMRASQRNEFGIQLNPRLNQRLRDEEAPLLYN